MREINHLSLHQWLRPAIPDSQQPTSPIGFLFLKLPPPPCAVLLVDERGCAMVILLPWCDFPLPDVTFCIAAVMGMMWLFPHDVTWARRSYYALFAEVVPAYLTFSLHGGIRVWTSVPLTYVWAFGFVGCILFYLLLFLSHRLLLLLFSLFPSFTQSYSFSNQSSAGRRVVCSARGGLSRVCYNGTLYPSNEGNPLVFWWIAVTLLWPGRGDFSASGLSTFKKIALTSALDCNMYI